MITAHPTMKLQDIDPKNNPSFSTKLFKYMKKQGVFYENGGVADGLYRVKPGSASYEADQLNLWLGYVADGAFFGVRIMQAMSMGLKAQKWAHPRLVKDIEEVPGFWDQYLKEGRCAIDPEHQIPFQDDRFDETDHDRTCKWCGYKQKKVSTPRTVYDISWVKVEESK